MIYPTKPLPNVNNAAKLLLLPNGLCLYNGSTHTLDILIAFETIKKLLSICYMTENCLHAQ